MRVIHLCVAIDSRLAHALRRTPGDTSQGPAIGVWQYSSAFVHALDEHAVVVDWRFSDLPSMGSSPGGFSSVWVVRVFSSLTRLQHLPEPRIYQGNGVSRRRCHGILLTAGSVAITIPEVFSKAYGLVGMACGNTYSSVVYILWRIQLIVIWETLKRLAGVSRPDFVVYTRGWFLKPWRWLYQGCKKLHSMVIHYCVVGCVITKIRYLRALVFQVPQVPALPPESVRSVHGRTQTHLPDPRPP